MVDAVRHLGWVSLRFVEELGRLTTFTGHIVRCTLALRV